MAGSVKGLFKRKWASVESGKPGAEFRLAKAEGKQWDKRGEKLDNMFDPEMPAAPAEEPAIPMADEEEVKRAKRRNAAMRGGGRASTIFTESDRLGS